MPEASAPRSPVKVPLFSAAQERVGDFEVAGGVFGREGDVGLLHEAVKIQEHLHAQDSVLSEMEQKVAALQAGAAS